MTAINCFATRDAVYVMTDGLVIDSTGAVEPHERTKAYALAPLSAVIASRGRGIVLRLMLALIEDAAPKISTFDDLATCIGEIARQLESTWQGSGSVTFGPLGNFELVLAGWSAENEAPAIYMVHNHANLGLTPFEPICVDWLVTPGGNDILGRLADEGLHPLGHDFDPISDGVRIMRLQRDWPESATGRFCQAHTITRDGIASRIVERWPT